MTDIAKDEARWQALTAKARELAAAQGPGAAAACEAALGAGEMVRAVVRRMMERGPSVPELAWVKAQRKKLRAVAKAREERKRIRREACGTGLSFGTLAWWRHVVHSRSAKVAWTRRRFSDGLASEKALADARSKARHSAMVYAAHCAAAGAVPRVEA